MKEIIVATSLNKMKIETVYSTYCFGGKRI